MWSTHARARSRHAHRAIEADDLAVEVRVEQNRLDKRAELLGLAEARRERDARGETVAYLVMTR